MISTVKQNKVWKKEIMNRLKTLMKKMNLELNHPLEETMEDTKKNKTGFRE